MTRLSPVDPAHATGRAKEIFDGPLKGKSFNIFKSMAQSPAALDYYLAASGALHKASLTAKELEIVQLTIGQANNCDYCVSAHTAIGASVGLSADQAIQARKGGGTDPKLGAIAKFALAIHQKKGFVTDADVQAFQSAGFGNGAIAEIVAAYSLAIFTNYFNHINHTPVDFPAVPKI